MASMRVALRLSLELRYKDGVFASKTSIRKSSSNKPPHKTPLSIRQPRGNAKINSGLDYAEDAEAKVDAAISLLPQFLEEGSEEDRDALVAEVTNLLFEAKDDVKSTAVRLTSHARRNAHRKLSRFIRNKENKKWFPGQNRKEGAKRKRSSSRTSSKKKAKAVHHNTKKICDRIFKEFEKSEDIAQLANQLGDAMVDFADDGKARAAFTKLAASHPNSKWKRPGTFRDFQKMRESGSFHRGDITGRKPVVSTEKLVAFLHENTADGRGVRGGNKEKDNELIAFATKENGGNRLSRSTLNRLKAMANSLPGLTPVSKVVEKGINRRTQERSLRRALGYATAVMVCHELLHWACVVNTDDKMLVVADYDSGAGSAIYWVRNSEEDPNGDHCFAKWTDKSPTTVNYLRAKFRSTISSGGRAAPLFLMAKVSRAQMGTCGKNVIAVPVCGLALGGDTKSTCEEIGYMVLYCTEGEASEDSALVKIAKLHRELILKPFFASIRKIHGLNGTEAYIANWLDSAYEHVQSVNADISSSEADQYVIEIRHNPAATGCEQANDCGPAFPILAEGVKPLTNELDELACPNFAVLNFRRALQIGEGKTLNLGALTNRMVELLIQRVVPAATKALTCRNIRKSFDNVGQMMIATQKPCVDKCLRTCRDKKLRTLERLEHYKTQFIPILKSLFKRTGQIEENQYEALGIGMDETPAGRKVAREYTMRNENCRRITWSNHAEVIKLRDAISQEKRRDEQRREANVERKIKKQLDLNESAEEKLMASVRTSCRSGTTRGGSTSHRVPTGRAKLIESATLEMFAGLKLGQLKAFILARSNSFHKSRGKKMPDDAQLRKGKLEELSAGQRATGFPANLIDAAHRYRRFVVCLKYKPPPTQSAPQDYSRATVFGQVVLADPVDADLTFSNANLIDTSGGCAASFISEDFETFLHKTFAGTSGGARLANMNQLQKKKKRALAMYVHKQLVERLGHHLRVRLGEKYEKFRKHYCWRFVAANLARCAAALVLSGHVRFLKELRHLDLGDSMLADLSKFTPLTEAYPIDSRPGRKKRETGKVLAGSYLTFDPDKNPRRSGMSMDIKSRQNEHAKKAKDKHAELRYYQTFPDESVPIELRNEETWDGPVFQDLLATLGIGLALPCGLGSHTRKKREKVIEQAASRFEFPADVLHRMRQTKHPSYAHKLTEYKACFLCYLFELVYDLAIGFKNNVSDSVGFELVNGIKVK